MFASLFEQYDRLVLFDTETTGLIYSRDEIIEFAAVVVEMVDGEPKITREYDELVALSPGGFVPPQIEPTPPFSRARTSWIFSPFTRIAALIPTSCAAPSKPMACPGKWSTPTGRWMMSSPQWPS